MTIYIGTSGWSYDHWQSVLYPPGTDPWSRLPFYLPHFNSVELNSSFYRWPKNERFRRLHARLPEGFILSVKAARGLTHGKKLYAPEQWIERFRMCWHELSGSRGVLLLQLPPTLEYDWPRLNYLLQLVPPWMRTAFEFRHSSWNRPETFELLERWGAAYCVMSGAGLPCILQATTGFVYVRLHGPDHNHLYGGSYTDADLQWWAHRIREWAGQGRDVFAYFNNDGGGHAVRNAMRLRDLTCC